MSYVFTVVFSAINVVLIGLAFGFEIIPLIVGNALLLCLSFPLFFRYSRCDMVAPECELQPRSI
jgi:hypothetical protein